MADYPTLNEVEPSWADIRISIPIHGGETIVTPEIAAAKWSDKVEVGVVRGANGGKKMKRTTGQYTPEASLTFYRSGWKVTRDGLALKDKRISLVGFDVLIQHTPPGTSQIFNVKWVGCRIIGRTHDMTEGTDPEKIEIPLDVMQIEEDDGITLL